MWSHGGIRRTFWSIECFGYSSSSIGCDCDIYHLFTHVYIYIYISRRSSGLGFARKEPIYRGVVGFQSRRQRLHQGWLHQLWNMEGWVDSNTRRIDASKTVSFWFESSWATLLCWMFSQFVFARQNVFGYHLLRRQWDSTTGNKGFAKMSSPSCCPLLLHGVEIVLIWICWVLVDSMKETLSSFLLSWGGMCIHMCQFNFSSGLSGKFVIAISCSYTNGQMICVCSYTLQVCQLWVEWYGLKLWVSNLQIHHGRTVRINAFNLGFANTFWSWSTKRQICTV